MTRVAPIGRKIAELRKERGLKQKSFAEDVGVSESTLRKVETKDYQIPRKTLEEIANKLQVELAQVLKSPEIVSSTKTPVHGDDQIEVRPVSSSGLMDLLRFVDVVYSEMHIDVTREMVAPIRTILDIAKVFSRRREGPFVFTDYDANWHDHAELYASAEITEAMRKLQELGVVVLANKKFQFGTDMLCHVGISFEKDGVTSRIIDICPF